MSKSKVSVKYGMIETRVRVPNIDLGGWPAVWLLGTANYAWPRCGELDMMEMGAQQSFRDLHDTHNGGNGLNNATVNQAVSANAIFYTPAAVSPQNPVRRGQPLLGPERHLLPPLLQLRAGPRRAVPDLPDVLGRRQPALHRHRRRRGT